MNALSSNAKIVFMLFVCFVSASSTVASADSIQLRNGRHLQGKFIGGSTTMIGFMTAQSVEYFQTSDVVALIFDNNPAYSPNGLPQDRRDGSSPTCSPAAHKVTTHRHWNSKFEIRSGVVGD